jgi:hypothetical protein
MATWIKQVIGIFNGLPYVVEMTVFFLLFIFFSKKASFLHCLYLQMISSLIIFLIKDVAIGNQWLALGQLNYSHQGLNHLLDNFLYFFHGKTLNNYYYNFFFFSRLNYLFYLKAILDIKNLNFEQFAQLFEPQTKPVYSLIFLIFSIFINNLFFPNLLWFKMQLDLLIILLLYMQHIGFYVFVDYVDEKLPKLSRINIFIIINFILNVMGSFFLESKSNIFLFFLGFFAYLLKIIFPRF